MESIFNFFENLFRNFTWGRLTFLVFSIMIICGGAIIYESYTNHFKLKRVDKELKIVESIIKIEKEIELLPDSSPGKRYFSRLISDTEQTTVPLNFQPNIQTYKLQRI